MPKYRKKPIVVEAIQVTQEMIDGYERFPYWAWQQIGMTIDSLGNKSYFVSTPEGDMSFGIGDYLIQGVKEEVYSCKADVFEISYEEVDA